MKSNETKVGTRFATELKLPWGKNNWHVIAVECEVTAVHSHTFDWKVARVVSETGAPPTGARVVKVGVTGGASLDSLSTHFKATLLG